MAEAARAEHVGRGADEIAAVTDQDRVRGDQLVDLGADAKRVDRHLVGGELRAELLPLRGLEGAQLLEPAARQQGAPLGTARARRERFHDEARVPDDADVAAAVLAQLLAVEVDVDELGGRVDVGAAPVADAEVERRAEDHDHVGALERVLAGLEEPVRIGGVEAAARLPVHVHRHPEGAHELGIGLAPPRPEELAAHEADGSLGAAQQLEGLLDEARIGPHARLGAIVGRHHDVVVVHRVEEEVERHLQEHRARHVGGGDAERGRDVLAEAARARHRHGPLGDRPHQVDVVHVLQPAHVLEQARSLTADDDHGDVGAPGGRDAGDRIGQAGARGDDGDAGLPGDAAPAVRGVGRRLLVAHVDHADALVQAAVVDRHHVSAAEREDVGHALLLERARDDPSSVYRHGSPRSASGADLDLP